MSWSQIAETQRLVQDEQGPILKDWGGRLPIALVFPNTYFLGMSSLAVHSLYGLWNRRDDVVCERVFTDWQPPLSLESGSPLDYFPVVALTVSHELDYVNFVAMLRSAGIPLRAAERRDTDPIVIAGGPAVSANPEPLAPILDACLIGEVEPILAPLTDALLQMPAGRTEVMDALARVPGVYLPNDGAGPSDRGASGQGSAGLRVQRQWLADLDSYPTFSRIITPRTEFKSMGLIEIARGCGRGCRFCLAGYVYRPPRQRSVGAILEQARHLLKSTERLGLVSAAVSDHGHIDELAVELRRLGALISVSSMRVDPLSEPLIRALAESGTQTLTIAPEAGSERLRKIINKTQTEDDVLRAVDLARRYGLSQLKLYFMIGLPGECPEDLEALVELARACANRFSRHVTVNITPFVPKAHTPFQRLAQAPAPVVKQRIDAIAAGLRPLGITVRSESPAWAEVQGTLARGDRRLADALLTIGRLTPANWKRALETAGTSPEAYLRQRRDDEALPWGFIDSGVHPAFLHREARRSEAGRQSSPCLTAGCDPCRRCGMEAEQPPFGPDP